MTLALFVLGLCQAQWLLSAGSVALGLGLGSLQIVNLTRFAFIGGRLGRGKVSGLTPFVATSGSLLGSFLGGVIGHTLGLQYVFLAYALAFAALLALVRVRPAAAQRTELLPDPSPRS